MKFFAFEKIAMRKTFTNLCLPQRGKGDHEVVDEVCVLNYLISKGESSFPLRGTKNEIRPWRVKSEQARMKFAIRRADTPNDARYRKRYTHAMKSIFASAKMEEKKPSHCDGFFYINLLFLQNNGRIS